MRRIRWLISYRWARIPIGVRFATAVGLISIATFAPWIYWNLAQLRHFQSTQSQLLQMRQAKVVELLIERELSHMLHHAEAHSLCRETVEAVARRDTRWLSTNLIRRLFQQAPYDVVLVLNAQGEPVANAGEAGDWIRESPLLQDARRGVGGAGLTKHGDTVYLMSAVPIYGEAWSKPPAGVLVLGRVLDSVWLNQLADQSGYPSVLSVEILADKPATLSDSPAREATLLRDLTGVPVAIVRSAVSAERMRLLDGVASSLHRYLLVISLILALATSFALVGLLRGYLSRFRDALQQLASGAWETRIPYIARDEFGFFAQAFNRMAQQLQQAFETQQQQREAIQRQNEELQALYQQLQAAHEELAQLNAELLEANRMLEQAAVTDGLTGLKNHRAFQESLQSLVQMAERLRQPLSLIMLDIDYFKQFNDRFGHPAGDELLCQVAQVLRDSARAYDIAARYGGEEFALLLPNTTLEQAVQVAERLRRQISAIQNPHAPVSASLGVATYRHGTAPATLLYEADAALYQAKRSGRNQVRVYQPEAA